MTGRAIVMATEIFVSHTAPGDEMNQCEGNGQETGPRTQASLSLAMYFAQQIENVDRAVVSRQAVAGFNINEVVVAQVGEAR